MGRLGDFLLPVPASTFADRRPWFYIYVSAVTQREENKGTAKFAHAVCTGSLRVPSSGLGCHTLCPPRRKPHARENPRAIGSLLAWKWKPRATRSRGVCVCVCEWGGAGWEGQHCTRQRGCQHDPGRPEATGLRAGSLRQPPAQPSPSPTASCGATPAPAPAGGRGGGQGQPRRRQTTAAAAAAGPPSPRRPRPGRRGRLRSAGRSRGRGGGGAHPRPAGAPPPARPPRRQHSRRQSWVT